MNPLPPVDGEWRSLFIYASVVAISIAAEWLRRIMPPPRLLESKEEKLLKKVEEILEEVEKDDDGLEEVEKEDDG
jgi:hypothetical protein